MPRKGWQGNGSGEKSRFVLNILKRSAIAQRERRVIGQMFRAELSSRAGQPAPDGIYKLTGARRSLPLKRGLCFTFIGLSQRVTRRRNSTLKAR